jgi:hypothetical protein
MTTTAAPGDANWPPLYGYMFRLTLPIFKSDGTGMVTTGTASGVVSTDEGTEGATAVPIQIATTSGKWYVDFTAAQMTGKQISGSITTDATGASPTPFVVPIERWAAIATGTATAGAASTITLAVGSSAKDGAYNGCFIGIDSGTGAGQQRRIVGYVGSTRVATVDAAWGTTVSTDSVYSIYPSRVATSVAAWQGQPVADTATNGYPVTTHKVGSGTGEINGSGKVPATLAAGDVTGNVPADVKAFTVQPNPAPTVGQIRTEMETLGGKLNTASVAASSASSYANSAYSAASSASSYAASAYSAASSAAGYAASAQGYANTAATQASAANTILSDGTNGNAAIKTAVGGVKTVVDAIAAVLAGITVLAKWLRALVRKDTADATAKSEINTGGGTYNEATDSQEAIRDKLPANLEDLSVMDTTGLVKATDDAGQSLATKKSRALS